ncbi:hypothetical protein CDAR_436051 [Caerostris darwini]|uniref:Uncharacterized protein n=1 Tax=Caerostris darwini TaxID=1538125 RepID=A0AAV4SFH5_9ARAC|nr:hypothetical protein CDAR_436051 [Caerostris darwini]
MRVSCSSKMRSDLCGSPCSGIDYIEGCEWVFRLESIEAITGRGLLKLRALLRRKTAQRTPLKAPLNPFKGALRENVLYSKDAKVLYYLSGHLK